MFETLRTHPEISMSNVKETEFFNSHHQKGYSWYEEHFSSSVTNVVGEISTNYYLDPAVPKRIRDYNREMKLIVNLRDPYALMRSIYIFGLRRGLQLADLNEELDQPMGKLMGSGYQARLLDDALTVSDQATLLDAVRLMSRLKPFFDSFDSSQVYIFIYERLGSELEVVLSEIYDFLGVESDFRPEAADRIINASVVPKSPLAARLASRSSSLLRKFRFHGLLSFLHRSELIKKAVFSSAVNVSKGLDTRAVVSARVRSILDDEMEALLEYHPPLKKWWIPRSGSVSSN